MTDSGEHGAIPPRVELPRLVDDCNSKTYDAARARLAHLETVWQRQADEIGRMLGRVDERGQAIARVRVVAEELYSGPREVSACGLRERILGAINPPSEPRGCVDRRHRVPACEMVGCRQCVARPEPTKGVTHATSCAGETGFKICYCDCGDCNGPDGRCACEYCGGWHDEDQELPSADRPKRQGARRIDTATALDGPTQEQTP